MYIGENLKRIRKEYRMTQEQLAYLVGCSKSSINQYEMNLKQPRDEILKKNSSSF